MAFTDFVSKYMCHLNLNYYEIIRLLATAWLSYFWLIPG